MGAYGITRGSGWVIYSGGLESAVVCQPTGGGLSVAGLEFGSSRVSIAGGVSSNRREKSRVPGVKTCGSFLRGVQRVRTAQRGRVLAVAGLIHI